MKTFKSILCTLMMSMMALSVSAQFSLGPALIYGSDTDLGFGLKAEFSVADKITASPSFAFLSSSSIDFVGTTIKTSINELNLDGHYSLSDDGTINWYGLAGLNFNL